MKLHVNVLNLGAEVLVDKDKIIGFELCEHHAQTSTDPLSLIVQKQLDEYSAGERETFDLPLSFKGTVFQHKVWEALLSIPYGETRSYLDIAKQIGSPKASRAVGGACHCNPIGLIIPCHRVVGSSGALTGYAGGLDLKKQLLMHEKGSI